MLFFPNITHDQAYQIQIYIFLVSVLSFFRNNFILIIVARQNLKPFDTLIQVSGKKLNEFLEKKQVLKIIFLLVNLLTTYKFKACVLSSIHECNLLDFLFKRTWHFLLSREYTSLNFAILLSQKLRMNGTNPLDISKLWI